jgi:hypothetical protein
MFWVLPSKADVENHIAKMAMKIVRLEVGFLS